MSFRLSGFSREWRSQLLLCEEQVSRLGLKSSLEMTYLAGLKSLRENLCRPYRGWGLGDMRTQRCALGFPESSRKAGLGYK